MGESARSTSGGGMVQCERCGGRFEISGDEGRAKKALACRECGHTVDAYVLPVVTEAKWTLVDPSGVATTFGSWADLLTALRHSGISAIHEKTEKPGSDPPPPMSRSAFALLENTPQAPPVSARPKLSVVDKKEAIREAETQDPPAVAPVAAMPPPPPAPPPPPQDDGAKKKEEDWADDVEMISLRDIQVVLPAPSSPAPPPRGALRTLPPAAGSDAPPPPTISVDDVAAAAAAPSAEQLSDDDIEPAPTTDRSPSMVERAEAEKAEKAESSKQKAKSEPKAEAATKSDRPEKPRSEKPKAEKPKSERKVETRAKSEPPPASRRPAARAAEREPEPDTKTWLVPIAAIAVAAAGIAFAMRGTPETTPPAPAPTVAQTAPAPTEEPTATAPVVVKPAVDTAPADSAAVQPVVEKTATAVTKPATETATKPATDSATKPATDTATKKPDPDFHLPLAETLDAAGKARRAGDFTKAKDLYNRALAQAPGNAEAYSGLASIARQTADLAGAKGNYQKALASSPGFLPALLGLADVEWELGDKSASRQHYEQYAKSASSVPDRVRERTQPAN